jgi:hypothetical protein
MLSALPLSAIVVAALVPVTSRAYGLVFVFSGIGSMIILASLAASMFDTERPRRVSSP